MTLTKLPLSASVDGRQVLISATVSASANPLHTAVTGSVAVDEIWLYAYNEATSSVQASINWGSLTEPNDVSRYTLLPQSGRTLLVDGKLLRNGLIVYAYASFPNVIVFDGFVNRSSP